MRLELPANFFSDHTSMHHAVINAVSCRKMAVQFSASLLSFIGVGDVPPKIREKIFFGQLLRKIRAFFGQKSCKIREFFKFFGQI